MLRTRLGPVGLRKPRPEEVIVLHGKDGTKRKIRKNWLASKERKKRDDIEAYRTPVKQAMLIAAAQMELEAIQGGRYNDPQSGREQTPEFLKERELYNKQQLAAMKNGTAPVPMKKLTHEKGHVSKLGVRATKHVLMKRSQKLGIVKTRWFAIDSGKLKIFGTNRPTAKAKHVYELKDVKCRFENKTMKNASEPWPSGWNERVCLQLPERQHGPLYLYGQDGGEAKSWERAVKMSKFLQSPSDREALASVVLRVAGVAMAKGWNALFAYAKELAATKQLLKSCAMRMMRVDLTRGWTKARLVYHSRRDSEKIRREQQEWAARVLKEKMERINQTNVRSAKLVRKGMIEAIQTKFRQYRQERIFDRAYPLGSSVTTRVQQALTGSMMGLSFTSVRASDVLHLVLNDESLYQLRSDPEIFFCKRKTYSEVEVPVCQANINVSESFDMLSFAELDEQADHAQLARANWAHFVHLDQISSVVLHTERMMNKSSKRYELHPRMCGGTWFTINGPRVCWGRQIRKHVDSKTKEERREVIGASNGVGIASALARGDKVRWFRMAICVRNVSIPSEKHRDAGEMRVYSSQQEDDFLDEDVHGMPEDNRMPGKNKNDERLTYMVINFLGRQFKTAAEPGDSPVYNGDFEAEVPVSFDDQALRVLDDMVVTVDIVQWADDPKNHRTICAGKMPLWKVFGPEESMLYRSERDQNNTLNSTLNSSMMTITGFNDEPEEVISMTHTLAGGSAKKTQQMRLVSPVVKRQEQHAAAAYAELEVTARLQESAEPTRKCISPELQGRGPLTALYCTHRGAWYDPKLGPAKFFADHVANFLELVIKDVVFPNHDKVDPVKLSKYCVEVKCNGVTQSTIALHRAREAWSKVIPVDPQKIDFGSSKLFLPLPPGAWCSMDQRPHVELSLLRVPEHEALAMNFKELLSSNGKPSPAVPSWEKVYHAVLSIDGLLVDQTQDGKTISLKRAVEAPDVTSLASLHFIQIQTAAIVVLDATLRDRDYVRLSAATTESTAPELGQEGHICVGDKAMLRVEEPLSYPQTDLEFRRRFLPGEWDKNLAKKGATGNFDAWSAPLRDPSMSHEYAVSSFDKLEKPPKFKQRYIPTSCDDVIPHKFVLARSELDFLRRGRPGIFWRVMNSLVEKGLQAPDPSSAAASFQDNTQLMDPRPTEITFVDPRDKGQRIGVIGFNYPGKAEECDNLCRSAFLSNFWDLNSDGLELEAKSKSQQLSETRFFRNSEAAFQALKYWDEAERFRGASGEETFQLKRGLRVEEDFQYGGYGNNWLAMLAVLRAKFSQSRACANALLQTDDSYLVEHNSTSGRDMVWSNNSKGDGMNWMGLQLMVVRDELRTQRGGQATWTNYITAICGIDLKTGSAGKGANKDEWQNTVQHATNALLERLAEPSRPVEATTPRNDEDGLGGSRGRGPVIVSELTHLARHIPCTVLGAYANGTCDLEVAPIFMHEWERKPDRHYTIPGMVEIKEFIDSSRGAVLTAPVGTGDVGERYRRRVILREVPIWSLTALQHASFNVYDAAFANVDEAISVHPNNIGNDFNPCAIGDNIDDLTFVAGRRGGYSIRAGPLPADAGPTAQYEWSLHAHAKSEDDVYHFLTVLRQAVRLDHAQQLVKMREYKKKQAAMSAKGSAYRMGPVMTMASGHLEVVLVEGRHLRPQRVQRDRDLTMKMKRMSQTELNPFVVFKLVNGTEEIIYRGSKTQSAPPISGNSPNWSAMPELQSSGGWVFKSPSIEPMAMRDLYIEIAVHHQATMSTPIVGLVQVPVIGQGSTGGAPAVNLCNPDEPFQNLWLPLSMPNAEGELIPSISGEVHIMTLWVPSQQTQRSKRLPKTARQWLNHDLRPKLQQSVLREPFYEIQVRKQGYNPNLYREHYPEKRFEANAHHIEALTDTTPYLKCCERQDLAQWEQFTAKLREMQHHSQGQGSATDSEGGEFGDMPVPKSLGVWRTEWARKHPQLVYEVDELVRRGVPPSWRKQVWLEITSADKVMDAIPGAGTFAAHDSQEALETYRRLVAYGKPYRNDAMLQLFEDCVGAAAWETSQVAHVMDLHLQRLKRAQDVCIALIAFSQDVDSMVSSNPGVLNYFDYTAHGEGACGIAYCEGLLVLAFFLLLAQTPGDPWDGEVQATNSNFRSKTDAQVAAQNEEDEARAFWLLYTISGSPVNGAYRAYYGVPTKYNDPLNPDHNPIADRRGAMDDVYRLTHCITRYENDLCIHLNALGFHLANVFYGAFMRLFAFILPASSLFRFWDLLFADSAHPTLANHKPARHSLIDLAFGTLRICKTQLMSCESALEARDCIVGFLESIYDPCTVVEIATEAERYLWDEHVTVESVALEPLHTMDYNRAVFMWEQHFKQFRAQNFVMRDLTRDTEVNVDQRTGTASAQTMMNNNKLTGLQSDSRVTTKNVVNFIIPTLQTLLATGEQNNKFGGMIRHTPKKIRELGPESDRTIVGKVWGLANWAAERIGAAEDLTHPMAFGVPPPPDTPGEPTNLDHMEFTRQVQKGLGSAWNNVLARIYETFASPVERRMSLNEFFIALICCSKGTVGEKAMALFHLYASVQPAHKIHHITPVTHNATTVVEKIEGNQQKAEGHLFQAPRDEDVKKMALHLRVYGHMQGRDNMLLGDIFVPTLRPFVWSGMGADLPQNFTIWGVEKALPPGAAASTMTNTQQNGSQREHSVRNCIGEAYIAIKWMPSSEQTPEIGQLGLHLYHIYLNPTSVSAPSLKNPSVTVATYDEMGNEVQIKRWDPRTGLRHAVNTITADVAYAGAFGEHIEFAETMRRDALGRLHYHVFSGDHGWDKQEEKWRWSQKWGDQYSVEVFKVRKELVKSSNVRPNTISLKACRLITQGILNRGLHCCTNRQAALMSDHTFNRAGAVPGILDAILVQGEDTSFRSIQQLKEEYDRARRKYVDVKHQIAVAHESSVTLSGGNVNLFPAAQRGAENFVSLESIKIQDPFPKHKKMLWIRFARGGDGQRFNAQVKVDEDGNFPATNIPLDMDMDTMAGKVQMSVTKDEFVTCLLSSPLLSESLRQLSTTDNQTRNVPPGQPIKLDVTIADPTQEEADEDFLDSMNVRQSVLFEIWDKNQASLDAFLGECWLPPLGDIGPTPRRFVLSVENTPAVQEGNTRPDPRKDLGAKVKCKGELHVEVSWTLPAMPVEDEDPSGPSEETYERRVKREEQLHTGRLHLSIMKATGLRVSDIVRRHGSDPYVWVHVRNDTLVKTPHGELPTGFGPGGWRVQFGTGIHDPVMKTNYKARTVNPEWNETKEIELKTGSFEVRTTRSFRLTDHLDVSGRQRQAAEDQHGAAVLGDLEEISVHFGDEERAPVSHAAGHRHDVKVYLGESIYQFKHKLAKACALEASREEDPKKRTQFEAIARSMSYRHVVMVFVPSQRLRELAQQQRTNAHEYKRLYKLEFRDPSSWQPLDSIRTFNHYAAMYGFGMTMAQRLRISEGTDDYKLRNNRFRHFQHEQDRWQERVEELNSEQECYGYAQFAHRRDGGSTEWRRAIVYRPEQEVEATVAKRRLKVKFIYSPLSAWSEVSVASGSRDMNDEMMKEDIDEDMVLLAPPHPRILGSTNLEHQEFLAKAKQLQDAGMSEQDIAAQLNEELREKTQRMKDIEAMGGAAAMPAASKITVGDVQWALNMAESSIGLDNVMTRAGGTAPTVSKVAPAPSATSPDPRSSRSAQGR